MQGFQTRSPPMTRDHLKNFQTFFYEGPLIYFSLKPLFNYIVLTVVAKLFDPPWTIAGMFNPNLMVGQKNYFLMPTG